MTTHLSFEETVHPTDGLIGAIARALNTFSARHPALGGRFEVMTYEGHVAVAYDPQARHDADTPRREIRIVPEEPFTL